MSQEDIHAPVDDASFTVHVEEHCIGCNTCVMVCGSVFALRSGSSDEQKSYVKDGAPLTAVESDIDTAVTMCPVTAIIKEPK